VNADATLRLVHTRTYSDPSAFSSLAAIWHRLLARDPTATVFHTPQYLATWWSEFGHGRALRIVTVGEDDAPAGIAALVDLGDGTLDFVGDHDTTDYRGPVSAPEDRETVAEALLAAHDDWARFHADGLAADTGWPEAFTVAAKAAGHTVEEEPQDACPRLAIPASYGSYLAGLSGKLRHEIQRKTRRLERDGGPFTVRLSTEATLDDDLERFFAMHRSSDGPKGRFMHEGMATFFGSFAWMLFSQGWLRLSLLEVGGETWAGMYGYAYKNVWGVWNSAYMHGRRELSPGMVLVSECVRLAAEEGRDTFDFLRGTEPYKYRFGAVDTPLIGLAIIHS
jgi:CelD/BcsL family acetyltransferase involved in cellulose biosynthesis